MNPQFVKVGKFAVSVIHIASVQFNDDGSLTVHTISNAVSTSDPEEMLELNRLINGVPDPAENYFAEQPDSVITSIDYGIGQNPPADVPLADPPAPLQAPENDPPPADPYAVQVDPNANEVQA